MNYALLVLVNGGINNPLHLLGWYSDAVMVPALGN